MWAPSSARTASSASRESLYSCRKDLAHSVDSAYKLNSQYFREGTIVLRLIETNTYQEGKSVLNIQRNDAAIFKEIILNISFPCTGGNTANIESSTRHFQLLVIKKRNSNESEEEEKY